MVWGNVENRNMIGRYDMVYERKGVGDRLGSVLGLGFVWLIRLVGKGRGGGVEGNWDVSGILFG